jgi:hypothetical protein
MEHRGWVQFSNGVSLNTHKEFSLEILMTMAPILDEGVPSFSFRLEGVEQVVPYVLGSYLVFKREPCNKWMCKGTLEGFWSMIAGEDHQRRNTIWNPIIQVFNSYVQKDFGENEKNKGSRHGVELALLGFD